MTTSLRELVGKINLTPGRPALDAADLEALCDLYLEESARRVSPVTLAGYVYALSLFRRWWQEAGPRLDWRLTRQDLQVFERWLTDYESPKTSARLTYQTRSVILQRLRQVLRYGHQHDYIERDYSVWVPAPTGQTSTRTVLQVALLGNLMQAAGAFRYPTRNQAILAVFIGTGMRRAECAQLDVSDVRFDVRGGGQIDIRRGKGGKARTVVFNEATAGFLAAHLAATGVSSGPLWIGQTGSRLTVEAIYRVVKQAARRAGLAEVIQGPHDLRRLFATVWNRGRKGLGYAKPLSLQLGHESAEMTLHYILQDVEDIRAVFVSPFDFMGAHGRDEENGSGEMISFDGRS